MVKWHYGGAERRLRRQEAGERAELIDTLAEDYWNGQRPAQVSDTGTARLDICTPLRLLRIELRRKTAHPPTLVLRMLVKR